MVQNLYINIAIAIANNKRPVSYNCLWLYQGKVFIKWVPLLSPIDIRHKTKSHYVILLIQVGSQLLKPRMEQHHPFCSNSGMYHICRCIVLLIIFTSISNNIHFHTYQYAISYQHPHVHSWEGSSQLSIQMANNLHC